MPRIRTVKPEFFQHEDLSSLDAETHLLALALVCYADDEGYFNANSGLVKGIMLPLRGQPKSIGVMLEELAKIGYLRLGTGPDGKKYGHIVHFKSHQVISHAKDSKISNMEISWKSTGTVLEPSSNAPVTVHPEGKGMEGKGREGNCAVAPPVFPAGDFVNDDTPPPGLHELSYAPRVLQDIGLPETRGNIAMVGAAIRARARADPSAYPAAVMYITARALDDKSEGIAINKFWFEDGKYEQSTAKAKSGLDY